jgi:hypothetical protein
MNSSLFLRVYPQGFFIEFRQEGKRGEGGGDSFSALGNNPPLPPLPSGKLGKRKNLN